MSQETPPAATLELLAQQIEHLTDNVDLATSRLEAGQNRIETQTTSTNGRVTSLERWQIEVLAKESQHLQDSMQVEKVVALQRSWTQPVVTGLIVGIVTGVSLLIITVTLGVPAQ
jgi:hypothetical protein